MDRKGKLAIKCDLCIEKLKKGEKPACVVACTVGALEYKSIDKIVDEKEKKLAKNYLVVRKKKKSKG